MMANDILIRDATPADAEIIQSMIAGLAKDVSGPDQVLTVEDVKRYGFGADPDFFTLIAEIDGSAAGLALYFNEFSTWRGRRGVYLQDLYVMPDARGRGVGEELIRQLAIEAKSNGAVYLRLAVDAENEAVIQEALDRLMYGRTTLILAHRLASVIDADRILVLDSGQVVQSGRHEYLSHRDGPYRRLTEATPPTGRVIQHCTRR